MQSYISRAVINDFALVSDCAYVAQNATRILRALFEIALSRNWGPTASKILSLCKSFDRRLWPFQHPLSQFDAIPVDIIEKLERSTSKMTIEEMRLLSVSEIGALVRHMKMGDTVVRCLEEFPTLYLEADVAPITRTVLKVSLHITPGKPLQNY